MPPSTRIAEPLMPDAAADARNGTAIKGASIHPRACLTLLDVPHNAALHAHRRAVDARRGGRRQERHRGCDLVRLQEALQQRGALVLREVRGRLRLRAAPCTVRVSGKRCAARCARPGLKGSLQGLGGD